MEYIKKIDVDKIIGVIIIIISSIILVKIESQINNIGYGMWYCFIAFTTIGFGDITVTTLIGKLIIIVALTTRVLSNYY